MVKHSLNAVCILLASLIFYVRTFVELYAEDKGLCTDLLICLPLQGASEVMTRVAEVLRAAAAEEPSSAERGDGGGDAKPPAERVAESIGEALAQGVGVAIKGNSSKKAGGL